MNQLPTRNKNAMAIRKTGSTPPRPRWIFDPVTNKILGITPIWPNSNPTDAKAANPPAKNPMKSGLLRLPAPVPKPKQSKRKPVKIEEFKSNTTRNHYNKMIDRAREYIKAGDIFQVVLSQRFAAPFKLPPFSLYRALRQLNPSPFLFYLSFG